MWSRYSFPRCLVTKYCKLLLAAAAKSLQSCPTLWDPIDSSPPGSPVPGILQARTLEWVAISFSKAIEIYSLVVLVARSLKSRCWQGGFLLEALMENLFHVFPLHSGEVKSLSHVRLFATPWTVAHQAPWSMGFSRHEYWNGLPFPSPGDLPDPGIEPRSLAV